MEKGDGNMKETWKCSLLILLLATFGFSGIAAAQDSTWTLEKAMAYAKANNLDIQQQVLSERVAKMQYDQSRLAMLPGISLSTSYGRNFGRSIDPTSNSFNSTTYDFTGLSGSAGVLLFGWFRVRHAIAKNDLLHQAAQADLNQLEYDICLNVATAYLRILLAREQVNISLNRLAVSNKQVRQTESLLAAGRSNGLDLAQVKTQQIVDSSAYFKAGLAYQQAKIDMKALLNLGWSDPFDAAPLGIRDMEPSVLLLEPELIYQEAAARLGGIQSSMLKMQSAQKDLAMAKSNLYPQLQFSASSGTNYSSTYSETLPDGKNRVMPAGKQLQNNFSQSVYLGLSMPVFNGFSSRLAIRQAKVNLQNSVLQNNQAKLKLQQDIYKACNEVLTAFQTYRAAKSAAAMARTGEDFAGRRYEKGLIPAIELLLAQNTAFKADADESSAKYDLLFKLMVIDYYTGKRH